MCYCCEGVQCARQTFVWEGIDGIPVPTYQPARVGAINLLHYISVWTPRCGQCGHFCEVHKLNPRKMLWAMCRGFSQKKIPVIFYSANFWMSSEFWMMKPVYKERKKQIQGCSLFLWIPYLKCIHFVKTLMQVFTGCDGINERVTVVKGWMSCTPPPTPTHPQREITESRQTAFCQAVVWKLFPIHLRQSWGFYQHPGSFKDSFTLQYFISIHVRGALDSLYFVV